MAHLLIRNVEDSVRDRLRTRAEINGRSMEDELRHILQIASQEELPRGGPGTGIEDEKLRGEVRPAEPG